MPGGGRGSCEVLANEYSCTQVTGAQINFGELTPFLTYGSKHRGPGEEQKTTTAKEARCSLQILSHKINLTTLS
jgi:hypothetical protein